jgi:23S rRNA-/tRNA-specific pseudouridylate synthase
LEPEIISVAPEPTDELNSTDLETDAEHCTAVVGRLDHGARIDKFLAQRFPSLSRAYFQHLLAQGDVACAGKPVSKASTAVKVGMVVEVVLRPTEQAGHFCLRR